ncbi:MAG: hypothetical protein ACOY3P_04130 [Planctomycetota bacterium]
MGLMRFAVTPPERLSDALWQRAYLGGVDGTSWQSRTTYADGLLTLQRSAPDSAALQVPWPVAGRGQTTLSTATLAERNVPYHLPLELARGVVNQLREQMADWEGIGLAVSPKTTATVRSAIESLAWAAVTQDDPVKSARWAETAIIDALSAGEAAAAAYVEQAFLSRRRAASKHGAWLGANLGPNVLNDAMAGVFVGAFNAARVALDWRRIEAAEGRFQWNLADAQIAWCQSQGLKTCVGPLLDLGPDSVPDWLYLWEDDFESILGFASDYVRAAIERYRGKADLWFCACRINVGDILGLSEEERLRLTARAVELVRSLDAGTPMVVGFDQPWAEYLVRRPRDVAPLHLADALVRAGLPISGLMLDMHFEFADNATLPRNLLEVSRQLDLWSVFGVPLWISTSAPGSASGDAETDESSPNAQATLRGQQLWTARHVPLMLAKPFVRGVLWSPLRDNQPDAVVHGGLFDASGQPKPVLRTLASIKQRYLTRRPKG